MGSRVLRRFAVVSDRSETFASVTEISALKAVIIHFNCTGWTLGKMQINSSQRSAQQVGSRRAQFHRGPFFNWRDEDPEWHTYTDMPGDYTLT